MACPDGHRCSLALPPSVAATGLPVLGGIAAFIFVRLVVVVRRSSRKSGTARMPGRGQEDRGLSTTAL